MDDLELLSRAVIPTSLLDKFRPAMKPAGTLYLGHGEGRLAPFEAMAAGADFDAVLFHPADVVEFHEVEPAKPSVGQASRTDPRVDTVGDAVGVDDSREDGAEQHDGARDAQVGRAAGGAEEKDGDGDEAAGPRRTVRRWPRDRGSIELPGLRYDVVYLDGVLSGMSPAAGDRVIGQVRRAVRPGGLVFASALSTGSPEFQRLEAASETVARGTFELGDGELARFVAPGELAMAFTGWMLLHAVGGGPPAAAADDGRPASVVVARRPEGGTLLA